MTAVAVVAHRRKVLGDGLGELRERLRVAGVTEPLWREVSKSKQAPAAVQDAVDDGAELVMVWGGDGMVQRSVDSLAGSKVPLAIVPAGTANLLASNLGIPADIEAAVRIALHGGRRSLDVGRINGEHFVVMAGTGLDALMIRDADRQLKDKVGKLAYVATGMRHVWHRPVPMRIKVDGRTWFDGKASCALLGNVGQIIGGLQAFDDARPDDGLLDVGVVTAKRPTQWARVLARIAAGRSDRSPFVQITRGAKVRIRMAEAMPYQLDGGDRKKTDRIKVDVVPGGITVCVPGGAA